MNQADVNRRKFLTRSTGTLAAGAIASQALPTLAAAPRGVHTSSRQTLRIGLIGCGGRGTGAVVNAVKADENTEVTGLADAFPDRIASCEATLNKNATVQGNCGSMKATAFRDSTRPRT